MERNATLRRVLVLLAGAISALYAHAAVDWEYQFVQQDSSESSVFATGEFWVSDTIVRQGWVLDSVQGAYSNGLPQGPSDLHGSGLDALDFLIGGLGQSLHVTLDSFHTEDAVNGFPSWRLHLQARPGQMPTGSFDFIDEADVSEFHWKFDARGSQADYFSDANGCAQFPTVCSATGAMRALPPVQLAEPATVLMFGLGLLILVALLRRSGGREGHAQH